MSALLSIIIALLIVGLVLYLVKLAPGDARIKQAIAAIVIVVVLVWLLRILWPMIPAIGRP